MSENIINLNQEIPQEDTAKAKELSNLALLETHLQVSNLVKILFTVSYDTLSSIVANSPEELKNTPHYKILQASLNYYNSLIEANQP